MYKLSTDFIDKMINARLTSKEINFLLYVAMYQEENGKVYSVYYKDVCDKIRISVQKFYDIVKSLEEKGIIAVQKNEACDISVVLLGNDFTAKSYVKGEADAAKYFKIAKINVLDSKFLKLKAGAKLLYLYLDRFNKTGRHGFIETMYNEFCTLLGCAKKTIREYLHALKELRLLYVSVKRNRSYNYELCIKHSREKELKVIPNEFDFKLHNQKAHIRRNFIKFLPKDQDKTKKFFDDIGSILNTQRARGRIDFFDLIVSAVHGSIDLQKQEEKEKPVLNAALINKLLTSNLINA